MKKLFTLFCLLTYSFINYGQSTYFSQDFLANTTITNYIGNPASINQFTENPAGVTTTITSGRYQIAKVVTTAVNYRFGRYVDFASEPKSMYCQFNFGVATAAAVTKNSAIVLNLGAGYDAVTAPTATNTYAKLVFNLIAGGLTFQLNDGTTNSANFTGNQNITFVMNNTGATFTYVAPNGTNETLGNDLFDVWVGITKVFNDRPVTTATQSIKRFRFDVSHDAAVANAPTIYFDNFLMRDVTGSLLVNTNVATPDSMLVKYTGAAKNVGLGTSTPGAKLEVNPTTANTSGVRLTQLKSTSPAAAANGKVLSVNANGDIVLVKDSLGAAGGGGFSLPALTSGSVLFSNGTTISQNNSKLFWDNTNFRLGVGTVTPTQSLDVVGGAKISGLAGTGNRMVVTDASGNLTSQAIPAGAVADNLGNHSATQNIALNGFALTNNGTGSGINVTNTGNVGIGTVTPSTKLTIQDFNPILRLETTQSPTGYYTEMASLYDATQPFVLKVGLDKLLGIKRLMASNPNTQSYINGRYGIGFTTQTGEPDSTNLKMFIAPNGDVGIGTYKPTAKLDVNGEVKFREYRTFLTHQDAQIRFGNANANGTWGLGISGDATDDFILYNNKNNTLPFIVKDGTGNVGIGTTTPQTKLDVRGSILAGNTDYVNGTIGSVLQIQQGTSSGNTYSEIGAFISGGSAWGNLVLNRGGGNVGIGTTTPTNKLEINGTGSGLRFTNLKSTSLTSSYTGKVLTVDANGDVVLVKDSIGIVGAGANAWALSGNNISNTNSGNVGIGTTPTSKLDVAGTITTGASGSTEGVDALSMRYTGNETINNWGSLRSSSASYMGYGVKASPTVGNGFISSTPSAVVGKAAFTTGWNAGGFQFATAPAQSSVIGNATTLNPVMSITNDGNVGIGTTTPTAKLDIQGATGLKIASTDGIGITFKGRVGDNSSQIRFHDNSNVLSSIIGQVGNELRFYTGGSTGTDTQTRMVITNGGFVGIGTGGPISTLHTNGNLTVGSGVNGSAVATMQLRSDGTTPIANKLTYGTDGTGWGFAIGKSQGGVVTDQFIVKDNGNVGIGTVTPTAKLDLVGGTQRIRYAVGTNDYTNVAQHQGQFRITNGLGTQQSRALEIALLDNGTGVIQANELGIGYNNLALNPVNGNVGIGTATPTEKLEVNGTAKINSQLFVGNKFSSSTPLNVNQNTGYPYSAVFAHSDTTINRMLIVGQFGNEKVMGLQSSIFTTGNLTSLSLNPSGGNVGIGTTNPLVKLDVQGGINFNNKIYNQNKLNYHSDEGSSTNGQNKMAVALYSIGKKLYTDETFKKGTNNISVYDNNGSGKVTISRINAPVGTPNNSGYVLEIKHTSNIATPGYGGFYFSNQTRANATFACIFKAKLPAGYVLNFASNAFGNEGKSFWATDNIGTGKWEDYVYIVKCGVGGNLNTTNFFYVTDGIAPSSDSPLIWHLSSATVFDCDDRDNSEGIAQQSDINGYKTFFTNGMSAVVEQPKRYEIARIFNDPVSWSYTSPVEIELQEGYYASGASRKYNVYFGYLNTKGILTQTEVKDPTEQGTGAVGVNNFQLTIGNPVVDGTIKYLPVYADVKYYSTVKALIKTARPTTPNSTGGIPGSIYVNTSPAGTDIPVFIPNNNSEFSTAGGNSIFNGNVGIGTKNPASALQIVNANPILKIGTLGEIGGEIQFGNANHGLKRGYKDGNDVGLFTTAGDLYLSTLTNSNIATQFVLKNSGNVGIGTATPQAKLHVGYNGTGYSSILSESVETPFALYTKTISNAPYAETFRLGLKYNDIENNGFISFYRGGDSNGGFLGLSTNGAERMKIAANGNVGIGTTNPTALLQISTRTKFNADGTVNWGQQFDGGLLSWDTGKAIVAGMSGKALSLGSDGGADKLYISTNGNIGIGTTTPSAKLEIASASGSGLKLSGLAGAAIRPLSVNASGEVVVGDAVIANPSANAWTVTGNNISNSVLTGNVGIGTATPTAKLEVNGEVKFNEYRTFLTHQDAQIRFGNANANGTWGIGISGDATDDFLLANNKNNTIPLFIKDANGNVGIGTTTPSNSLSVVKDQSGPTSISVSNLGTPGPNTLMQFLLSEDGISPQGYLRRYRDGSGLTEVGYTDALAFSGGVSSTKSEKMRISTNGNVGIGTTAPTEKLSVLHGGGTTPFGAFGVDVTSFSTTPNAVNSYFFRVRDIGASSTPFIINGIGQVGIGVTNLPSGYKLAVAGDMIAERVVVKLQSSGWPDYVFTPSYHLSTLPEVEKYIEQNHHLPNVPSAKEVADKGIDVGAMNTKFMEKIEELTLYLIEQNKKLEALEKKNIELENAIKNIKK